MRHVYLQSIEEVLCQLILLVHRSYVLVHAHLIAVHGVSEHTWMHHIVTADNFEALDF